MRVVLTGGGTGGHIYPALAVAKEILRHEPQATFLYIGTTNGIEASVVPKHGIPFESIEISGLKRKISLENVKTVLQFFRSVSRSKEILRRFKPDVVIGTGGYVCGPVVYAAAKLGIKTIIHEQNVEPGITNKFLSRYVDKVAVSFEESLPYFSAGKTVLTGNPRATEVIHADAEKGREALHIPNDKKIVLIVGGSRGARAINESAFQFISSMSKFPDCHFVYVTGEVHFDTVNFQVQEKKIIPSNFTLLPYVHDMPDLLAATQVIVNRAGASFLAEITALGVPAVLIPSPYVTNNHQEKNARGLEKAGAALVLLERDLTGVTLEKALAQLLLDEKKWSSMRQSSLQLGMPEAATRIYELLRSLSQHK